MFFIIEKKKCESNDVYLTNIHIADIFKCFQRESVDVKGNKIFSWLCERLTSGTNNVKRNLSGTENGTDLFSKEVL